MSNDPLSDVLRLLEARAVVTGGFAAGGRWAIRFPPPEWIKFAALANGTCWLQVDGHRRAVKLEEGDVFLLSAKRGYVVGSDVKARPRDYRQVFREPGAFVELGGSDCVVLAGQVRLHPSSASLFTEVLPDLVHVRGRSAEAAALRWIVERIVVERTSPLPGASIATAQLAQLLLIQSLRAHVAGARSLPPGWLRAIGDERLTPALQLMHADPGRAWTLPELAKAAAMSRTSFAVHFKAVAGLSPIAYLTEWRMRLAQKLLREGDAPVLQLAEMLGYSSESAFSNAFKRVTGMAPHRYRAEERSRQAADGAALSTA